MSSRPEDRHLAEAVLSGSGAEVIGGVGVIVLTILGLSNVAPGFMAAISTIVLGGTMLLQGGSVAAEYSEIVSRTSNGTLETAEVGGGMTADMVAGVAGIVLGILALLGLATQVLTASAVIVFGAALAMSGGTVQRLNDLKLETYDVQPRVQRMAHQAITGAAGTQLLVGLAVIVLGILALVGVAPLVLSLIGLLAVASSLVISGSTVGGRFVGLFRR
jgi:hypothetical protein